MPRSLATPPDTGATLMTSTSEPLRPSTQMLAGPLVALKFSDDAYTLPCGSTAMPSGRLQLALSSGPKFSTEPASGAATAGRDTERTSASVVSDTSFLMAPLLMRNWAESSARRSDQQKADEHHRYAEQVRELEDPRGAGERDGPTRRDDEDSERDDRVRDRAAP